MNSRLNIAHDVIIDAMLVNNADKLSRALFMMSARRLVQTSFSVREKQRLASPFECADMRLSLGG
jgi:hypothetical protein